MTIEPINQAGCRFASHQTLALPPSPLSLSALNSIILPPSHSLIVED